MNSETARTTIAYLGDEYSFSRAAADAFGGRPERYPTIRAALAAVAEGKADCAAVPIENSLEGSVRETLDGLRELSLYVRAETVMPIAQHLIGIEGAGEDEVKTVYSHPQALAQCRRYIEARKLDARAVSSTSEGLARVNDRTTAAIARAPKPGQKILRAHVEDEPSNATRFVLVSRTPRFTGGKVSVAFETPNRPGALLAALEIFSQCGLNLTHIESRPHRGGIGRYVFFVDFLFGGGKDALMDVFARLGAKTEFLKFLGKYDPDGGK